MPVAVKEQEAHAIERPELTHGQILRLYIPLALSWVFMALEGPTNTAIVGRLPLPDLNTASLQVLLGISLWIESPVIDLLSTSTTLAKNRQHYGQIRRFTFALMAWVTFAHALFVLTPLYGFVTLRVLNLVPAVVYNAHVALIIMIPWSACIGWRRHLQGILIRYHRTRLISAGTLIRISTMTCVGWGTFFFSHLPGIQIAAIALISAVAAEALCIHIFSRGVVRREFGGAKPRDKATETVGFAPSEVAESAVVDGDGVVGIPPKEKFLSTRTLLAFHLPLTATTMVALIGNPLISSELSRSASPVLSMAGWQVAGTFIWLCRTVEFALPEVIITLYKDQKTARKLHQFATRVGMAIATWMSLFAITGLDKTFFMKVLGERADTASVAHLAFCCAITLPLIGAQQNYVKGLLTAHHLTTARFMSSIVSFTTLVVMLIVGVLLRWPGVVTAAVALNISLIFETLVLWSFLRKGLTKPILAI